MNWKKVGFAVLGVLTLTAVGLGVATSLQPDQVVVRRSRIIQATPEQISPYLTDLHQWLTWNPWDELEPTSVKEFSDPASGVGAWYTWRGEQLGSGRMEIDSITPAEVRYALHFTAPLESAAEVQIDLEPEAGATRVTWTMSSEQSFVGKLFGVFVDMDAMLGADFERGLENLAEEVASAP